MSYQVLNGKVIPRVKNYEFKKWVKEAREANYSKNDKKRAKRADKKLESDCPYCL